MPTLFDFDKQENTPAERLARRYRFTLILFITLITLAIVACAWFYTSAAAGSRRALRNAKDLRTAMQMTSIELYQSGGSIFDPKQPDGLREGVKEKLQQLSDADGTLLLTGWDNQLGDALSFTYREGNYMVVFRKNTAVATTSADIGADPSVDPAGEDSWEVYLFVRVSDY